MRIRIYLAIFCSFLLIGLSFWTRVEKSRDSNPSLDLIAKDSSPSEEINLIDSWIENQATTTLNQKPLTGTDLIGRQLIMDYIDLAQNGHSTPSNIQALVDTYIENIPALVTSSKATYLDLNVTNNTKDSFAKYIEGLLSIQKDYGTAAEKIGAPNTNIESQTSSFYAYSQAMEKIYRETAQNLLALSVPGNLAEKHLELVNVYLSSSAAMSYLSRTQNDPATGFAGIVIWNENIAKERSILLEIEKYLRANGV